MTFPQFLLVGGLVLATNLVVYLAARRLVWRLTDAVNARISRQAMINFHVADALQDLRTGRTTAKVVPFPGHVGPKPPGGH